MRPLRAVRVSSAALVLSLAGVLASPAQAQGSAPRVVIDVSGGVQGSGPAVSDRLEFESNVETASIDVRYPSGSSTMLTGGLGVRVWKQLGLGVSVSNATRSGSADIDGRIPHPFFFGQPRTLTGSSSGIERTETAAHLQVLVAVPVSRRFVLTLSGGPTLMRLEQSLVAEVRYDDTYPFDAVKFTSTRTERKKASAAGVNAGADLRWMLTRALGVGALVRYASANVDLGVTGGQTLRIRAGGVQAGAGLRVVF